MECPLDARTEAECEQEKQRLQASVTDAAANPPKSTLRRPGRDMLAARYRNCAMRFD